MVKLKGKKIIIIGDRDGVHGEEIESTLKQMGYNPIFSCTECFVCTAAGTVDLPNQRRIKEIAQDKDPSEFIVLLGACDSEGASIHARTVTSGDPSYIGALTGIKSRLPVYHVFEHEIKDQIDKDIYRNTIGLIEDSLGKDEVESVIKTIRDIRMKESQLDE